MKTKIALLSTDSPRYKKRLALTLNARLNGFYCKSPGVAIKCNGARIRGGFMEIRAIYGAPPKNGMRQSSKPQRWIFPPADATYEDGSGQEIVASREQEPTGCTSQKNTSRT